LTGGAPEPPRLVVVGVDGSGAEVVRFFLGHGDDPVALLASRGWEVRKARDVASGSSGSHVLTMTFVVGSLVGGHPEPPEQAVAREVWEESGQVIEVSGIAVASTTRWIGRAPSGRLEDFHAVRIVYRASCHAPTDSGVHDIGGTTESARRVPPADLGRLDVAPSWRSLMSGVVMAPDEADGPQHHEHQPDTDDPARPKT